VTKIAVSVIMPAFNAERFLLEAADSILIQSMSELELIIVDDASVDETPRICEELCRRDGRVRVVRRSENGGISAALNDGLKLARGGFIARMDSDDISVPDRLKLQVRFLEAHPEVSLCGMAIELMDENGLTVARQEAIQGQAFVEAALRFCSPVAHPTWMMRAELLHAIGGYRPVAPAEDYDFLLRVYRGGYGIDNLGELGLRYRISGTSTAASNSLRQRKAFNFIRRIHMKGGPLNSGRYRRAIATSAFGKRLHQISERLLQRSARSAANGAPLAFAMVLVAAVMSPYQLQFVWRAVRTKLILRRARKAKERGR
jgi:glycosyltransferase involved in cell wall biosynthesis